MSHRFIRSPQYSRVTHAPRIVSLIELNSLNLFSYAQIRVYAVFITPWSEVGHDIVMSTTRVTRAIVLYENYSTYVPRNVRKYAL